MAANQITIGQTISNEEMQVLSGQPEIGQVISDEDMQTMSPQSIEIGQSLTDEQLEVLMTPQEKSSSWLKDMGKDFLKSSQKLISTTIGVLSSPLAFNWSAQSQYVKLPKDIPQWKKELISIGAGFVGVAEMMKKAVTKGEFPELYWEKYYKDVTGKTIEEDMIISFKSMGVPDPERLAANLAPIASVLGEIVSDPIITFGEASRIARLKMPKIVPEKILKRLGVLSEIEEKELKTRLVTTLGQRKDYKATIDKLAKAQEVRRPPEMAIGKIKKEIPEISKRIAEIPPSLHKPKMTVAELRAQKQVMLEKAVRGEPKVTYLPKITKEEKVYWVKGTKPVVLKSAGGAVLGIEEDEQGNIKYNPITATAGTLLMAGGMKLQPKNVKRFADTMKKNPAWAKVVSGIGQEKRAFSIPGILSSINLKLFERFGKLKGASLKAYEAARTFSSFKDQAMLKFIELQKALKPIAKDEFSFTSYVKAHRDLSRAERGLKNPGNVTLNDAKQAIKEIETHWKGKGKNVKELKDSMELWNQWTHDHILAEAFDNGIISKAAYDDILKNNKWYATYDVLDYIPENLHNIPVSVSKEWFSVANQKVIQTMIGTERLIGDPIEATIRKFTQAQATFAKNKVASILVDDPNMKNLMQPIAMSKKEFAIMKNQGKNPVMTGTWNKRDFDVINRFKEGRVERYMVPKEIADAMKQLTPWQAPRIVQAYNSIFRAAATTLRLAFTIGNAARDAFMAYCSSPVFKTKDILYNFEKQWLKGAWEGIKFEFLGKPSLIDDYVKSGGGFGYAGAEAFERGIGKIAAKKMLFKKTPLRVGTEIIKSPLTLMEKINSVVELAPRIGNFDMAMKLGYTNKEAAMIGRQATIDFNRGGVWAKAVNQFVPFLNARIQARVVLYEALKRDHKGTMAKMFVSTVLPGMSLYAWNRLYYSDLYDDIPEYIKGNYFTFIYGKETNEEGKVVPKYFVIAKGDTGQIAWNPIEFGLEQEYRKDPKKILNFCINYLSDLSPVEFAREGTISLSKAAGGLLPPMAKGPIEDWANLKFYQGTEIIPYYMGKTKPPELQYKDLTPETYKWLGEKIGVSPLRMQNYMTNFIAGYGREGLSPVAMLRGIQGRIIKTQAGKIDRQAFIVIKDIEKGYFNVRAYAEELIKDGSRSAAFRLMNEWNKGLNNQIKEFNEKFKKYDIQDRGGLKKSYFFTPSKRKNLLKKRIKEGRMRPLEKRLRRKGGLTLRQAHKTINK